jgi:hypothetical protein
MNGTNVISGGPLSPNPGTDWQVIGSGDFYDNGLSDILWQNTDGQAAIWEMNGAILIGGGAVSPNPGASWKAIKACIFLRKAETVAIITCDGELDCSALAGQNERSKVGTDLRLLESSNTTQDRRASFFYLNRP